MSCREYTRARFSLVWVVIVLAGCSGLPGSMPSDDARSVDKHIQIAMAHEENGQWEKALAEYKTALAKDGDNLQALFNVGNVYTQLKQYREAEVYYRAVLQQDSESPTVKNNLAWVLVLQGENLEEAEALIDKAMHADPERVSVYFDTKVYLYLRQKRYDDAVNSIEAAENLLSPDDDAMKAHLAKTRSIVQRVIESQGALDLLLPSPDLPIGIVP